MGKRSRANRQAPNSLAPAPKPSGVLGFISQIKPVWAVLCVLIGGAFAFVVQSDDFFKNLQKLPASADNTLAKYQRWVYEDDEWRGKWSTDVEGYVDAESMALAGDARLEIDIDRGEIGGMITTRRMCKELPMLGAVMIEGSVLGNNATVRAYDYVMGREVTFGEVKLKRSGVVIEVVPVDDPLNLFPQPLRLGKDIGSVIVEHPTATDIGSVVVDQAADATEPNILSFCSAEMEAFLKKIRPPGLVKGQRRPITP